jgi:hypothetical protein
MFYSPAFDVAGPGLIFVALALGVVALIIATLVIILLESVVLRLLKWGTFWRGLLASLVANIITTLIGLGLLIVLPTFGFWNILIAYLLSIIIEGGILIMFKRSSARENWIASAAMNTASYVLIIFPLFYFGSYA